MCYMALALLNSKFFSVVIPLDPRFRREVGGDEVASSCNIVWLYCPGGAPPIALPQGPHQLLCPRAPTNLNPALDRQINFMFDLDLILHIYA